MKSRIVVAGLSSYLGRHFVEQVLADSSWEVSGLCHTRRPETEQLIAQCVAGGSESEWFLPCDFGGDPCDYPNLAPLLPPSDAALTFVYMCGAWHSGPLHEQDAADIAKVVNVGLSGPIYCCSEVFRLRAAATASTRCVIVTGLGGERAGVRYLSLYGSVTGGIYNFIRSAGMELAGTRMSCAGLALGLFDKGQAYIHDLCEQLVTGVPTPLTDVLYALRELALVHRSSANGSIVEVAGGLMNYQKTAEILSSERRNR